MRSTEVAIMKFVPFARFNRNGLRLFIGFEADDPSFCHSQLDSFVFDICKGLEVISFLGFVVASEEFAG